MSLLVQESEYVDPSQLVYACDDINAGQQAGAQQPVAGAMNSVNQLQPQSAPALRQQQVAAQPDANTTAQQAAAAALKAQQVACSPETLAAANKAGTATKTKLVYLSGLYEKGQLSKDGVQMSFGASELQALFQAHAIDSDDRSQRRGDVSEVAINEISVLQTFNGGSLPIQIGGTGAMQGKTYALAHNTGRESGKNARIMWVINPGGINHHKPVVIFRRMKEELMHMARLVGSFDMGSVKAGLMDLGDGTVMVANHSFMSSFIFRQASKWNVPWNSFEQVRGAFRVMPKSLTDFAIQTLSGMRDHLQRNKHDLSQLGFTCSAVCSKGSLIGDYADDSTTVLIGMFLLIKYTFLRPDKLKIAYTGQ